jgi:NhaC family Na+:H+ antiporter
MRPGTPAIIWFGKKGIFELFQLVFHRHTTAKMSESSHKPTLLQSLIPIVFLIALLGINVMLYGNDTLSGPNQVALLLAAAVATLIGIRLKHDWQFLFKGAVDSIRSALPAIMILLLIGSLAGTWMLSGVVPAMIYYGLKILSPKIFLLAACIVCAIVSVATGSSWSTVATVGIALLGIGKALGWSDGLIAGAVISGAYFGDKMSPLSDTTNLAPAVAGTDLFTHIRYMAITTVPSILLTLIIFLGIGLTQASGGGEIDIEALLLSLENTFNLNPLLFLVPVAVITMIIKRMPAVPALLAGTLLGGLFALIFQPGLIRSLVDGDMNFASAAYLAIMNSMAKDVSIVTDNEVINELLSTGGMAGMLPTVWLIVCAMVFGGIMEAAGFLRRITESLILLARSTGSLIATTAGTCLFFNVTASDQYLSIVVPGRMFARTFRDRGLAPQNLSRTLEDSGTVTSVLIPWNTCGATQAGVLGVATVMYAPYCFFNIISPFMTILVGYLGIRIARIQNQQPESVETAV